MGPSKFVIGKRICFQSFFSQNWEHFTFQGTIFQCYIIPHNKAQTFSWTNKTKKTFLGCFFPILFCLEGCFNIFLTIVFPLIRRVLVVCSAPEGLRVLQVSVWVQPLHHSVTPNQKVSISRAFIIDFWCLQGLPGVDGQAGPKGNMVRIFLFFWSFAHF